MVIYIFIYFSSKLRNWKNNNTYYNYEFYCSDWLFSFHIIKCILEIRCIYITLPQLENLQLAATVKRWMHKFSFLFCR